jgi:folate-binding protein YgfZ
MPVSDGVRALEAGHAFVDLTPWRTIQVAGSDAVAWLNDLVTNRVDDVPESALRRTLFLDRTGHVRADVVVTRPLRAEGLVVVQDPVQRPIDGLLAPYILSSDVDLTDRTRDLGVVAMPDSRRPGGLLRLHGALGEPGDAARRAQLRAFAEREAVEASLADLEVGRIRAGVPRFGVDFGEDWLPSEAGLDDLVDATKGCFLGQESVARVRNLGHPPRVVQAFASIEPVTPMADITSGGEPVGRITSVAPNDDGSTACIGWVRWDARDAAVEARGGFGLVRRRSDGSG